jgi:hypothetical protein
LARRTIIDYPKERESYCPTDQKLDHATRWNPLNAYLLDDRTVTKFPPHLARELVQVNRPKERVRANGHLEAEKLLKGHVIANSASGCAIREIKPTPPERAVALGPLQSLSVAGAIRVIRRNPHGDIEGVILEDGILLHFLPHAGRQFAKLIRKGQLLVAVGFGTANNFGPTIAVAMLGRSLWNLVLDFPPSVNYQSLLTS